jgi:hypothetical protein
VPAFQVAAGENMKKDVGGVAGEFNGARGRGHGVGSAPGARSGFRSI